MNLMPLLIDGHNLIGKMTDLSLADPHDESKLVRKLYAYAELTQKRITVIFDPSPYDQTPVIARQKTQHGSYLTAIFAEPGVSADKLIRDKVSEAKDRQGLIVVTSDNAVASFARQTGIKVQTSSDFAKALSEKVSPPVSARAAIEIKPIPTRADVKAWGEVFVEPPPPPMPIQPPQPPVMDEAALKRARRMEQLKKQTNNQKKLSLTNTRPLTARERELQELQIRAEQRAVKAEKKV